MNENNPLLITDTFFLLIKKIARNRKNSTPNLTLQTTEIVNEAYLRLHDQFSDFEGNKNQLLAMLSESMRTFLVDYYRKKTADKRGGSSTAVSFEEVEFDIPAPDKFPDWLAVDQLLTKLENIDPVSSKIVELRYYVGLTSAETAEVLNINRRTVTRKWQFSRAFFRRQLQGN